LIIFFYLLIYYWKNGILILYQAYNEIRKTLCTRLEITYKIKNNFSSLYPPTINESYKSVKTLYIG
jgi:hypothetical protein